MDSTAAYIRQALYDRRDDPVEQARLAVLIANSVDVTRALDPDTHFLVFDALATHTKSLVDKTREIHENGQDITPHIAGYQQAYLNLAERYTFSASFQEKIGNAFDQTLVKEKQDAHWAEKSMRDKVATLDIVAHTFLDAYDPNHIIHDNAAIDDNPLVVVDFQPVPCAAPPAAYYNDQHKKIFVPAYAVVFGNNEDGIDYKASQDFYEETLTKQTEFEVDKTSPDEPLLNDAYDLNDPDRRVRSNVGDHGKSLASIGHELFHCVADRVIGLYEQDCALALNEFGFTDKDYKLLLTSKMALGTSGETYHKNKEEMFASKYEEQVLTGYTAKNAI
jgi:hypothetical protein